MDLSPGYCFLWRAMCRAAFLASRAQPEKGQLAQRTSSCLALPRRLREICTKICKSSASPAYALLMGPAWSAHGENHPYSDLPIAVATAAIEGRLVARIAAGSLHDR